MNNRMDNSVITIKNLEFKYNFKTGNILNIDNLAINENQIIGLIGANGSGKTTLMKLLSGYLTPDKGSIEILSGNFLKDDTIKNEIIFSTHNNQIEKGETPEKLMKKCSFCFPHFDKDFALKILDLLGIKKNKAISKMSTGQTSAVHFACALATRAKITLLDEPFTGIDIAKRKTLQEILLRDYMENPRTIIISSHNLDELENILSEILLINTSKVVFYNDIDEVREMYFRADGDITSFKANANVIKFSEGNVGNYIIVKGSPSCDLATEMKKSGLKISSVSPCDVCAYLTNTIETDKINELWD